MLLIGRRESDGDRRGEKKKIVSMTRARASVAPESCGIIFRVIHPPTRAPTAKQISAMSDPETERPAAPPIANPRKTTLPVMLAVKTWPSARKLTASTIPVTAVMLRRIDGDALGSFAGCASLTKPQNLYPAQKASS